MSFWTYYERCTWGKKKKWRIPPSPPEVKAFGVEKLPWIIVFDKKGRRGRL